MLLSQGSYALARRQEMLCTLNFFLLIDYYQLLTELRFKIYLDKHSNFANKICSMRITTFSHFVLTFFSWVHAFLGG